MSIITVAVSNAPAEGFFGTLKTEMFDGYDWAGVGLEELCA